MIHFVAFDPETGAILRFGHCLAEDFYAQQGDALAFEADPGVTDVSHRVDVATRTLIPLES